ncbi:hypothetical protein LSH36_697g03132 [Paralvinella palmiformis]|uniref:Tr-type G domain-containing protein n=1 Tax=Paralvinella palmiformis TaxID=53620 RepID=A0AAD9J384_9ANNE|nr:hypothetical protein LSH36_697g03132 [Paralvinella palmiformis]
MDPLIGLFVVGADDVEMPEVLPPELEEGNIEYKFKLINPTESRFEHLVTQMKWRLQEGDGEAIYEIGVEDNGLLTGLTSSELNGSLNTLTQMAERLGATTSVIRKKNIKEPYGVTRHVAEVLIRKVPDSQQFIDLRMAVLGNVDAGKSTLLGVLTHGEHDNGRGRARLNLFRHLHEIQSGRTSSISHEIIGFNSNGELINYSESRTAEEICQNSSKLITLIDLCGHQRYLKTTIFGLTGYSPDFAMLVISAKTGLVGTTKEHLGFALALQVPIVVTVSKTDTCSGSQVNAVISQVEKLLKSPGCKKVPFRIDTEDDAITAASHFHNESICPIFAVSSVTGQNLHLLLKFLNVLPPMHSTKEREKHIQQHAEHQIDEVYSIQGVGKVAGGTVLRGSIKEGDQLLLGPDGHGCFHPIKVLSLQRNRLPCRMATAGQTACISLGNLDLCPLRKGMVLLSPALQPSACYEFEADVYVLFHQSNTYICRGFQVVIHVANVRQTARIIKINKNGLRTNMRGVVRIRFNNRPEYLRVGSRLLFREGKTKGMGEITKVFPYYGDKDLPSR